MTEQSWRRKAALFLSSQTVSLFGSSLVQYAILWHITLETRSGVMMMLYTICGFIPTLLLSPFAGVWADRYNRKRLAMYADALIATVTLVMAIVFMTGHRSIPLLFIISIFRALGTAIQGPAVGAIIPQIVPQKELTRVNGLFGSIQSGIMFVAPIASGALLTFAKIEYIFFIDVLTAAIAISMLLFFLDIPLHQKAVRDPAVSYFHDMREGFRYIRNHTYLGTFFVYLGIFFFLITPSAFLTPLQTSRTFGTEVWRLTAIEIFFSVGMMLGGILISWWGGFKNRMHTMLISNLVMAVCAILLGVMPNFWLYLVVMWLFGIALPLYNTPSTVMIQEHVEEAYMGRVMSVLTMLSTSLMPIGMLIFGPLSDTLRIEWLLITTGGAMLLHAVWVVFNKQLMAAGVPVVNKQSP